MVADKDQPRVRMQMIWNKKRTRPLMPPKGLPFQLAEKEDADTSIASVDANERSATGVEGEQPTGIPRQSQFLGVSMEASEELEHSQQSERFLNEGNILAEV